MVGYITGNTLTENGAVKRGVCEEKDGYLTKIIESSVEINQMLDEIRPEQYRTFFRTDQNRK